MSFTTPTKATQDRNANIGSSKEQLSPALRKTFPYPQCWQDDERMQVLLAPFRERDVNPEHYDAKMKFWQDLIVDYCQHKGEATFCKRELQLMFARGERVPYGLDVVLTDLLRNKRIRTRSEYEYDPENSWTGWAINSLVKKPLSWGVHKLKSTLGATNNNEQALVQYVLLEVIKKFCKDLQAKVLEPNQGKLLHYDAFKALLATTSFKHLTEDCQHLCLHTLHCQRKIGLEYKQEQQEEREIHLVKIPSKTDSNINISASDHAVHNLQMTQTNLLKQLDAIESDIKVNEEKARQYVVENKRQLAKTYLRKKHLLEKNHEKRSLALHNIETLLSSVDEARSNGEILDAYKIGSKALQNTLNESGLKYDNVDEIISDVKDTIEAHTELQDTLATANIADNSIMGGGANYDNDELERELQQILGEVDKTPEKSKPLVTEKTPRKINITDADLLNMLQQLEVDSTPPSKYRIGSNSTHSTIHE